MQKSPVPVGVTYVQTSRRGTMGVVGNVSRFWFFFFQAEDGIRDLTVTGVQTCALPICVAAGSHTVVLSGIAGNCSVTGGTSRTVTVPAGGSVTASFAVSCTALPGNLTVTTTTAGLSLDLDGYTATVDGTTSQTVSNNGSVTFNGLSAGSHTVVLSGVAANCSVNGGTSQTVTVPAGGTATAAFSVTCTALPGSVTVSTTTSGGTPDPNGYTVSVTGGGHPPRRGQRERPLLQPHSRRQPRRPRR